MLLGYVAASGQLNPFQRAEANPPAANAAVTEEQADCCNGACKADLLVSAERSESARQDEKKSGKKPNIVVIMGDDVGWFNIGAYHQGMMAGRTPNLNRL